MWIYDPGTLRILDVNTAAIELYGYSRAEFLSRTLLDIRPPDAAHALRDHLERLDPRELIPSRWQHLTSDGRLLSVDVTAQGIDFEGRYARLVVLRDSTPLDALEAARLDAEARYRILVENLPDAVLLLDVETGHFIEANENACRLLGLTREEVLQLGPADIAPEFQPGGIRSDLEAPAVIARAMQGETIVVECTVRSASGEEILCEAHLIGVPSTSGRLVCGRIVDIRERKAADAELARLASVVRFAHDAIIVTDLAGRVITWNHGAETLFGLPAAEMLGATTDVMLPPDDLDLRIDLRRRVIDLGESVDLIERLWTRPDGATISVSASLFPIRDAAGSVTGIGTVVRDITRASAIDTALRLSEQRLQLAVDAARMGIWHWHLDTGAIEWSPEAAAIYNRPLSEMPPDVRSLVRNLHPDDRATARATSAREVASGELAESRVRLPDGSYRWVVTAGLPLPGDPNTVTGFVQDIHDRKMAEVEMLEGARRLREIIATLPSAVWIATGDSALMVNPELERLTGFSAADLLAADALDRVVHPDDIPLMTEHFEARIAGKEAVSRYIIRIIRSDGEIRHLAVSATQIALGGIPASLLSAIDITDRLLAEQELRQSEERFRTLIETVPVGIWVWDGTDIVMVNAALERLLGYSREQLTTRAFLGSRMNPDDLATIRERGRLRMAGFPVTPPHVEIRIQDSAGSWLTFELWASIIENDGGRLWFNSVVDLTARRAAEAERQRIDQQIQQTQKLESLGILAGGIAHDFNNLLVAVLGNAGLALMELPPESPARQTVQAIEIAAQRAADLTRQMLAYSGKGKFVIEPLNLSRIVEEMAHLLEVSVSKRAVLKYHFAPDLPPIEGDATQVRQVIMNLITNASDAIGSRSGVISISTGLQYADRDYLAESYLDSNLPEGDYVYIEVADTGEGMDEPTSARIFDPFFTTKFTGRGLGLAAVLGIVRGHHAAIKVYSEPGRGTTFKVLFPATASATPVAPLTERPLPRPAASMARGAILVVDDDETVRTVTRRILERAGFDAILAADGVEALHAYRATPGIVLVLMDMTMPRMDGEECFRELRRYDPAVRVILTSGYNEQDATTRFVGKGLAGFIQKPYRPTDLIEKVESLLSAPGQ